MLWWAVALVCGWLATGAVIPVLWKLSKLVSSDEPTGVTGKGMTLVEAVGPPIVDTATTG